MAYCLLKFKWTFVYLNAKNRLFSLCVQFSVKVLFSTKPFCGIVDSFAWCTQHSRQQLDFPPFSHCFVFNFAAGINKCLKCFCVCAERRFTQIDWAQTCVRPHFLEMFPFYSRPCSSIPVSCGWMSIGILRIYLKYVEFNRKSPNCSGFDSFNGFLQNTNRKNIINSQIQQ